MTIDHAFVVPANGSYLVNGCGFNGPLVVTTGVIGAGPGITITNFQGAYRTADGSRQACVLLTSDPSDGTATYVSICHVDRSTMPAWIDVGMRYMTLTNGWRLLNAGRISCPAADSITPPAATCAVAPPVQGNGVPTP